MNDSLNPTILTAEPADLSLFKVEGANEKFLQFSPLDPLDFDSVFQKKNKTSPCYRQMVEFGPKNQQIFLAKTSVDLGGIFLGKTNLHFTVKRKAENGADSGADKTDGAAAIESKFNYPIFVLRDKATLNHIFVGVLTILMILANILMGCRLHLDIVWAVIRRPLAPALGMLCQFLLMPMVNFFHFFFKNISFSKFIFDTSRDLYIISPFKCHVTNRLLKMIPRDFNVTLRAEFRRKKEKIRIDRVVPSPSFSLSPLPFLLPPPLPLVGGSVWMGYPFSDQ